MYIKYIVYKEDFMIQTHILKFIFDKYRLFVSSYTIL